MMTTAMLYQLVTPDGRPVRKATKVRFPDGYVIKFIDKLPSKEAIKQAKRHREILEG